MLTASIPSASIKCRMAILSSMGGSKTEGFCRPSRSVSSSRVTVRPAGISLPPTRFQSKMSSFSASTACACSGSSAKTTRARLSRCRCARSRQHPVAPIVLEAQAAFATGFPAREPHPVSTPERRARAPHIPPRPETAPAVAPWDPNASDRAPRITRQCLRVAAAPGPPRAECRRFSAPYAAESCVPNHHQEFFALTETEPLQAGPPCRQTCDRTTKHFALRIPPAFLVVGRWRRKGREVVPALKLACGLLHRRLVQWEGVVQNIAMEEGRKNGRSINPIKIRFTESLPARMKLRLHLFGLHNPNRGRQQCVQCPLKRTRGEPGSRMEMGDLSQGMHARIGAAGSVDDHALARDALQNVSQGSLNRRAPGLDLPAVEVGSIVGQRKSDVLHGSCGPPRLVRLREGSTNRLPGRTASSPC